VKAIKELGVKATYRNDLTIGTLRAAVKRGIPIVLSVYPEDWLSDHWVVVLGFDEDRIYLTNYKSLPIAKFKEEWFDRGEGLVCSQIEGWSAGV
jgi:hypothetical protein